MEEKDMSRDITGFFTGHRPAGFGGYDESLPVIVWAKAELEKAIRRGVERGYLHWISGLALGWDTWAAEAVIAVRKENPDVRLIAASPFPSQATRWPKESRIRHEAIRKAADLVVEVSQDPYAAWKMLARDKWMVDRASVGVAGYDGSEKGGTAHTVGYCGKAGIPWLRIDPKTMTTGWNMPDKNPVSQTRATLPGV